MTAQRCTCIFRRAVCICRNPPEAVTDADAAKAVADAGRVFIGGLWAVLKPPEARPP